MREIKTEIIIDAPLKKVWNVLTDNEKYGEWNPFILKMEGRLKEGEKLKNVLLIDGKKETFKPVILAFEPEKKLEWVGTLPLGMLRGQHYFILEKINNNQTKLRHGEQFSGWLSGLIMNKICEPTRNGFQQMNAALKLRAEAR